MLIRIVNGFRIHISVTLIIMSLIASGQVYTSMIKSPEDDMPLGISADNSYGSYLLTWRGTFNPNRSSPNYYFENYRNMIFHLDEQAEINDSIEVHIYGGYDWELWDLYLAGDSLLAWGTVFDSVNESCHLGLLWLGMELEILDYQIYGDFSDSVQFVDFVTDKQDNLIFAGLNSWTNELYLIKTDPSGIFLMDNSIAMWGSPWPNIGYLPASDQLICGSVNWVGIINNSDFMPDTICQPDIFIGGFEGVGWWVSYNEYGAILPGISLKEGPPARWNFSCVIFDSQGQVRDSTVFNTSYDQNYTMDVDFIKVDSIFFGGLENYISMDPEIWEFEQIDRYYYICMFNFDGDKFWTTHLGGNANYSLMCLTALKDNDCLVAGARYDWRNNTNQERDIMVFKIESNGVLVNTPEIQEPVSRIFPNPASDFIHIQFAEHQQDNHFGSKIVICDILGNEIFNKNCQNVNDLTIDTSDFKPGIYILFVKRDTYSILTMKVLII